MPEDPKPGTGDTTDPATPPSGQQPGTGEPAADDVKAWKERARLWEQRAKENSSAADKLRELEDKDKSEIQRATEKATAAEAKAAEAERRALRAEVALEKGLTGVLARRLQGDTREDIERDADELLAELGGSGDKEKQPKPAAKPVESLRGGTDPTGDVDETNPRKLAAQLPRF